jgi:hypothetical protein
MSKTLQALVSQAQGHIKAADEQAVPVNLALLARNQAEFNAALVDVLTHVGVIEEAATVVDDGQANA